MPLIIFLEISQHKTDLGTTRDGSKINERYKNELRLSVNFVILGHDANFRSDDMFYLTVLFVIFCIYTCKIKKVTPRFHLFKQYFRTALKKS